MIVSTFAPRGIDSGFTAISSGVRVPSEFTVHTLLDISLLWAVLSLYFEPPPRGGAGFSN